MADSWVITADNVGVSCLDETDPPVWIGRTALRSSNPGTPLIVGHSADRVSSNQLQFKALAEVIERFSLDRMESADWYVGERLADTTAVHVEAMHIDPRRSQTDATGSVAYKPGTMFSTDEAIVHALSEVIERDALARVWTGEFHLAEFESKYPQQRICGARTLERCFTVSGSTKTVVVVALTAGNVAACGASAYSDEVESLALHARLEAVRILYSLLQKQRLNFDIAGTRGWQDIDMASDRLWSQLDDYTSPRLIRNVSIPLPEWKEGIWVPIANALTTAAGWNVGRIWIPGALNRAGLRSMNLIKTPYIFP